MNSDPRIKSCPVCGDTFIPIGGTQIMCSPKCRELDRVAQMNKRWTQRDYKLEWAKNGNS